MADSRNQEASNDIRKQLHDLSNALTILMGKLESFAKCEVLTENEEEEIQELIAQGVFCFNILEKAKIAVRNSAT